ncbi:MAG: hypothetical protein COA79_17040 [Planctomycetota bacterium]|nr:MAG: hypothetical protein COA79_17040 [Planctomycetota bacterium]
MKNVKIIGLIFLATICLNITDAKKKKKYPFHRAITKNYIIEVSNTLPKKFLSEAKRKVLAAERFFTKIFRMPAGILTGNLSSNSQAFQRFKNELKKNTKVGGRIPTNIYEEWFGISGKVHYRIWDTQKDFANEWFDQTGVKEEDRAKQGIPGAYFSIGRDVGTDVDKKSFATRKIRAFVANKTPKSVIASLYHEIGHLYLMSYLMSFQGPKNSVPAWLNEGFAELFAYGLPSDKKTKRKKSKNKAILYELVQTGEYWKFDQFLKIDNAHNLKLVADKSAKSEIVYTQAWSVVEFLTSSPKYSSRFLKFLKDLRFSNVKNNVLRGKKATFFEMQKIAFKKNFGSDLSNLEGYWVKHVNKKYKSDLEKKPENNYYIGDFYLRRNNIEKAELFFGIAAEKAPQFCESHLGLGRLAYRKKKYAEASIYFGDAVKADLENEEAYMWLGYAQLNSGASAKAHLSFKRALEIDSNESQAMAGNGYALLSLQKYQEAEASFKMAYTKTRNLRHLFGQAKSLYGMGEYTSARRLFSALTSSSKNPELPFWVGMCSAHLKEKDYALKQLEIASKANNRYANVAKTMIKAINNKTKFPGFKP